MSDIVFICNANMCRSPIAEGILKLHLEKMQLTSVVVSSMGIHAVEGKSATETAVTVCGEHGIVLENHRSRPLVPDELKKSVLIFTMEAVQVEYIDLFFPQVSDRVYLLAAWPSRIERRKNINDPVGRSIAVYRKTFNRIETCIDQILPMILNRFSPQ